MLDLNRIFSHQPEAAATISGAPGYERLQGQVLFYPASGGTVVVAQLQGLPGDGFFGLHLHQGGACRTVREPFDGAGDHWGLPGQRHPGHLGDLPVLLSENGRAWSAVWTGRFLPSQARGHTVIVHRMADDYRSQPAGDAGARIGCGVIW